MTDGVVVRNYQFPRIDSLPSVFIECVGKNGKLCIDQRVYGCLLMLGIRISNLEAHVNEDAYHSFVQEFKTYKRHIIIIERTLPMSHEKVFSVEVITSGIGFT